MAKDLQEGVAEAGVEVHLVLKFAKDFILNSTNKGAKINYQKFKLDNKCKLKRSKIQIEFKHYDSGNNYAYGFEFDNDKVYEEWLYLISARKESKIFERIDDVVKFSVDYYKSEEDRIFIENISKSVRSNQLLLSVFHIQECDKYLSLEHVLNAIDWFDNKLKIVFPDSKVEGIEVALSADEEMQSLYKKFFEVFNIGISDIGFSESLFSEYKGIDEELKSRIISDLKSENVALLNSPAGFYIVKYKDDGEIYISKMQFKHMNAEGDEVEFKAEEESDGTLRLVDLFPMLNELLNKNVVYIVDEIERSLHTKLIYQIFQLFLLSTNKSQLIATTHDVQLLTQLLFRKDEIWFTNKNKSGATSLYSLEEFKIRFDKEIRKDYLMGVFGAIPRFKHISSLCK